MPSSYTNLLGFVLPTTGDLNGTWGATLNASLTQLVEDGVAGYATASVTSADWTLTTTGSGAQNEARMAILIATGTPGVSRDVYAPKLSKTYAVINSSNAAIVFRGGPSTPTTGVTLPAGTRAFVAWDTVAGDFKFVSPPVAANGSATNLAVPTPVMFGYATGAGGSVTQATSITTGVTLNKPCGAVNLASATLSAGVVYTFTLTNSVAAGFCFPAVWFTNNTTADLQIWVSRQASGFFVVALRSEAGTAVSGLQMAFAVLSIVTS